MFTDGDAAGTGILGVNREDQRYIIGQELTFRFPQTSIRLGGQFYRNISNEEFQHFYDWEDYQVRGILVRVFNPKWIGVLVNSYERKNYRQRNVPNTDTAERDDLLTFAASLIYQLSPTADLTYSLTYRHQDSNDPRLDFIDMINQLNLSVSF